MEHTKLKSSNVASAGYDPATKRLEVIFTSGGHYQFSDVPQDVYDSFLKAESFGRFFQANVRGKYPHKRLDVKKS